MKAHFWEAGIVTFGQLSLKTTHMHNMWHFHVKMSKNDWICVIYVVELSQMFPTMLETQRILKSIQGEGAFHLLACRCRWAEHQSVMVTKCNVNKTWAFPPASRQIDFHRLLRRRRRRWRLFLPWSLAVSRHHQTTSESFSSFRLRDPLVAEITHCEFKWLSK